MKRETASLMFDRTRRICELCAGQRVLDMGCCAHGDPDKLVPEEFLHGAIKQTARELVGLDNDREAIELLGRRGFPVVEGDAEQLSADQLGLFDVVVAGELIEHLSNPGLFLDGARRLLKPGGLLVATVPNAWSFTRLKQLYKGIDDRNWTHAQHTCWYSKATIRFLFERHGFQVKELGFCLPWQSERWLKRMRDRIRFGWALRPEFSESVFIVGQRK